MENQDEFIQSLLKERDELLKNRPSLIAYQRELDAILNGIDNPLDRCQIIVELLNDKLEDELVPKIKEFNKVISRVNKSLEVAMKEFTEEEKEKVC